MSGPDNLALHAASPSGGEGYVVLLFRPDTDGTVRYREWSSADYMAPGREDVMTVEEMNARVAAWSRAGWKLTESPIRIEHWLRDGR
jgi:hypothetical protein